MPVRRNILVLAALGASGVGLLLPPPAAARPGARLTAAPPAVTSEQTATFKWTVPRGTRRTLCRVHWLAPTDSAHVHTGVARDGPELARGVKPCSFPPD